MNTSTSNFVIIFFAIAFMSPSVVNAQETDSKAKQLLKAMTNVNGGWEKIASKKDVEFTYIYHDLKKGKDISTERYIFDNEVSWGEYEQHEVNILPGQAGVVKQNKINGIPKVTLSGKKITSQEAVNGTNFFRSVNYYWFTMMYKLEDPGTIHKYLGQETVNGVKYDKVRLTYDVKLVGKKVNDEFILFFNPKTHLVDRFMFSLPAWGIKKPILIMVLDYEKIEDIHIATKRKAFAPNDSGEYFTLVEFTTKNIKFNNGFTIADFKL
ncbi:DUF6503 family protein [Aquimarina sp. Aq107]|uniref:DUF6503 family protein n=1 Tax=Aquimarina sp. Aq107 TaxID=1191912 RepID=UPI000D55D4EE|nr:DUF6503 family protein [Aquimarina sp. Aq107]